MACQYLDCGATATKTIVIPTLVVPADDDLVLDYCDEHAHFITCHQGVFPGSRVVADLTGPPKPVL